MKGAWVRWALVAGMAVLASVVGGVFVGQAPAPSGGPVAGSSSAFALVPPAFAQATGGKSFLETEAGISVYVNTGQTIDLARAKPLFKVLEDETAEYVIGTVELSGYGEDWWPHVWIDKSGWIVVYYRKAEPTSRLMHWFGYRRDEITTTTLREVLFSVARRLGVDMARVEPGMRYYHWQYPGATRMLIVVDTTDAGTDTFNYTIPAGLTLHELTGSHFGDVGSHWGAHWSATYIGGIRFAAGGEGRYILVGAVAEKHLTPHTPHVVTLGHRGGWTGVALFFLYR